LRRGVLEERVIAWVATSRTWTRTIVEGQPLHPDRLAWDYHATNKLGEYEQPIP